MRFKAVKSSEVGKAIYHLEDETTILTARFVDDTGGEPGNVELSDPSGAIVMLDLTDGVLSGLEVVVWPEVKALKTLRMPGPDEMGVVAAKGSTNGSIVEEDEGSIECACNETGRLLRISVLGERSTRHVKVAEGSVVGLTSDGRIAAIWLDGLPEGIRNFL